MSQTYKQIRRLIKQADIVLINGYQYNVSAYNLLDDTDAAIKLIGDNLPPRSFKMEELLQAEQLDDYTLRVPISKHHLVFVKHQRLKIDGTK